MPNNNELSIKTDQLSKHFGHLVAAIFMLC